MLYFLCILYVNAQYCPRRSLLDTIPLEVNPLNFVNEKFAPTSNDEPLNNYPANGANQYVTIYTLSSFSLTLIYIDLRHLYNYPNDKGVAQFNYTAGDWKIVLNLNDGKVTLPSLFQSESVNKLTTFILSLFVYKESTLQILMEITNSSKFEPEKYMFMNTTKVQNVQSTRAIMNTNKIFVMELTSDTQITLPANILPLSADQAYLDYIISFSESSHFVQNEYTSYSPQIKYWGNKQSVILPYLPYFSNCQGFGEYIYLYQLTQHANCTLIPEADTVPINPFVFGMQSTSDICKGLLFTCILDEKYNINPRLPRWFELDLGTSMFSIKSDPIEPSLINDEYQIPSQEVISIQTLNSIPSGMMPLEVEVTLNYYQITKSDKRIIQGTVGFNNFYKLSNEQQQSKDPIYYNLKFNFIPMNQGELVNSFALEWPVYFLLYLIIGAVLVLELIIFLFYHYIFNRKSPRPSIKLFVYIKQTWPHSLIGVILALIPIMVLNMLITLFMSGKVWTTDLSYACELGPQSESDSGCAVVFFDIFKNNLKYTDSAFSNLRDARTGLSMLVCGGYIAFVVSGIFIWEKDKEQEIYNGNIKNDRLWKRSRFLYSSLIICFLMMILISFSFTNVFANNAYVFLIFNKVASMVIDYILEVHLDDNILISPISIIVDTYVNVATMGNPTFYEFLISTFVDKGVEMIERAYVIKVEDFVSKELEEQYEKLFKMLKRLLDEDEDVEMEDDKMLNTEKKMLNTDQDDDSDSDIIFSDDYQENLASDDESICSNKQSSNILHQSDNSFTKDDMDEFESKFQTLLAEYQSKLFNFQEELINSKQEETIDEADQTDLIDYFSNFANDIITLLYNPFITVIMWLFYTESHLLESYEIKQSEFIYYFLWAVILIPFQIIIDVLCYNLVEQYHELEFLTYINHAQQRFKNRKTLWKATEKDQSIKVEDNFKTLDQWCYSSQYYFVTTLYVAALQFVIFGMFILYMNNYDMFSDQAFIFIILFWIIVCIIVHKLAIFIGIKIKLWYVENRVFPEEANPVIMTSIEDLDLKSTTSQGVYPNLIIKNWNQAIEFREQNERLNEINNNLDQEQFQNDQFRKFFITSNKQWLGDNIRNLLTPRTLKTYRKQILDQFNLIYGPLEKKNEEDPVAGFDNAWNFKNLGKNTSADINRNSQPKQHKNQIPPSLMPILKYWLYRSRHQRTALNYIGGLLEMITKPYCEFCGLNWGLGVDPEQRIEDVYLKFLKIRKLQCITKDKGKEIDDWQNFFPKNCKFRTTCFICNMFMVEDQLKDTLIKQQEVKNQQKKKKFKYSFKKIASIILIWIKFIDIVKK